VIDYIQNYQRKVKEHVKRKNTGRIPNKFFIISQEGKDQSDEEVGGTYTVTGHLV
jgi:hypothetical protein